MTPLPVNGEVGLLGRLKRGFLRIRTRLLVVNLVAVLVPIIGIHWARTFEKEGLRALETDMRHVADTLRTVLERNSTGAAPFHLAEKSLTTIARRTRMRIRLLSKDLRVVADSHAVGAPEGPEAVPTFWGPRIPKRRHPPTSTNPGPTDDRIELRAAAKGQLGTATRYHHRIKRVFLFLAMPIMVKRRVVGVVYLTRSTVPVLAAMYRLRTSLMQVLGIALGFTALLSLFFAATISRPLARLTQAARRLAAGDRNASLHLDRTDEIGDLAHSLDMLQSKLDGRARYIAEFAANISHEFKTPLASMRGAAELLAEETEMDLETRQRFLGNILEDAHRLDRLVSRLLELSRIEATFHLDDQFRLDEVIATAIEPFRTANPTVETQVPDETTFRGNRANLIAALGALMENAVQHGAKGKPPHLSARCEGTRLILQVSNEGKGINPLNTDKIFDRFFTTTAASGGTGLGLAIVQTVAHAHGGTVTVDNKPGESVTFTLELPIAH